MVKMYNHQTFHKTVYYPEERRLSFITVQIEDMNIIELKQKKMNRALCIIDRDTTVFNDVLTLYYNFLKQICAYLYINNIFSKTFKVFQYNIYANNNIYRYFKNVFLRINDSTLFIGNSEIPYEYIILFNSKEEYIYIELFGSVKFVDKKIKIIPDDKKISLIVRFPTKDISRKVCEAIKRNMYYHIKHNKINEQVIEYFAELEK